MKWLLLSRIPLVCYWLEQHLPGERLQCYFYVQYHRSLRFLLRTTGRNLYGERI